MLYAFKPDYRFAVKTVAGTTHVVAPEEQEQTGRYKFGHYLIVTSQTTSIRKGAGTDFGVVQTIKRNGLLKYLSSNGNWHKVMVVGTERVGYVYHKNVK